MRKKVLHISLKRVPKIYICVLRHGLMLYNFFGLALKQCLHKVLLFANLLNFLYFKSYSLFHLNFLQPGSNFTLTSKTLTNRHEVGVNFLSSVFFFLSYLFPIQFPRKNQLVAGMFDFPFTPMKSSTQTELAGNRAAFSECMQNKPKIKFLQLCKFCVRVFSDVIDGHLMQQFEHQIFPHRTYFRKMIINLLSYANTLS